MPRIPFPTEPMAAERTLLDEARTAWRYTRGQTIAEVANLPAEGFDFRPAPGSRTGTELVRHIVANGRLMCGELTRPDGDFRRQGYDAFLAEYAGDVDAVSGREALIELLRVSHAEGDHRLAEVGEAFLLGTVRQFDGEPATRLSWLHHGIAHEEYHRGQLALYARLLGEVPALTKQIHGES